MRTAPPTRANRATAVWQSVCPALWRGLGSRPRAFYEGPVAEKIAAAVQAAGGIMTAQDLRDYKPILRRPVSSTYRGHRIVSMPPSSSGGVVLIEMLNILEGYKLGELDTAARE